MHELTHIDLFSGIGGFALAAQWAGFRTLCFSEIEPYASAVLRRHWPRTPNVGDIVKADFEAYAGATLLTGGFPCQPFSCAGKQRGAKDDRFLWPRMLEVIAQTRPTWVVGENVAGIIQMELDRVLSDMESQGYIAVPIVVPAVAVDARHRRDRVWIVANARGGRLGGTGEGKIQLPRGAEAFSSGETLANAAEQHGSIEGCEASELRRCRETLADPMLAGSLSATQSAIHRGETSAGARNEQPERLCRWPAEPQVGRVAHGIPSRVDRIKCLGNAIVPQVAFEILRQIATIERTQ